MNEYTIKYTIKTLEDFDQIPPAKLEACLVDFLYYLRFCRGLKDVVPQDALDQVKVVGFIWVDDGERGLSGIEIEGAKVTE